MRHLLLAVLLAGAARGEAAGPVRGAVPASIETETFSLPVPKGWAGARRDGDVELAGPDAEGFTARISARFIAAAPEALDEHLARLTAPSKTPRPPGWKEGKAAPASAGGRAGKRLERELTELVPPRSLDAREVALREERVLVPAQGGYYLLVYVAPASLDRRLRPAFKSVLAGFKPAR